MPTFILQICDTFLVSAGMMTRGFVFKPVFSGSEATQANRERTKSAWVFSLMCFLHLLLPPVPEHQTRTEILVLEEPLHH